MRNNMSLKRQDAEIARLRAENAKLRVALQRARQDINWMLNMRKFLSAGVFAYNDAAIAKHEKEG